MRSRRDYHSGGRPNQTVNQPPSTEKNQDPVIALAKHLKDQGAVELSYKVLDGSAAASSSLRFGLGFYNGNPDFIHKFLSTDIGLLTLCLDSIFFIGLSTLSYFFDQKGSTKTQKRIAKLWNYTRDLTKTKNGTRGTQVACQKLSQTAHFSTIAFLFPLGLALGILGGLNRIWMRNQVTEKRKKMMDINGELLKTIIQLTKTTATLNTANGKIEYELTPFNLLDGKKQTTPTVDGKKIRYLADLSNEFQKQSEHLKIAAISSAALGGLIDGSYLYVGVLALAAISTAWLLPLTVLSLTYAASCIITRIYEEQVFQRRLIVTELKCQLAITVQKMNSVIDTLAELNDSPSSDNTKRKLQNEWKTLQEQLTLEQKNLHKNLNYTRTTALIMGIRDGLALYGGFVVSPLFLLSMLLLATGTAFPPLLLVVAVFSGLGFIIGSVAASLLRRTQTEDKADVVEDQIRVLRNKHKALSSQGKIPTMPGLEYPLLETPPNDFIPEWAEVMRSLTANYYKFVKVIGLFTFSLQEADNRGHYHDSQTLSIVEFSLSAVFGVIMGARAFLKGFGGKTPGQVTQEDLLEKKDTAAPTPSPTSHARNRNGWFNAIRRAESPPHQGNNFIAAVTPAAHT